MKHATAFRIMLLVVVTLALCGVGSVRNASAQATAPPFTSSIAVPPEALPSEAFGANLILNGDFENQTFPLGCNFNLANATVTAGMANVTAFGQAEEIDVMNDGTNCGYSSPPQSGLVKLAIHRQEATFGGYTDAFAFDLSSPLVAGATYEISFYAQANVDFTANISDVEIGVSSIPTAFGTLVFSGTPAVTGWTLLSGLFVAPSSANYLTVQVAADVDGWNHIDNFSLEPQGTNATETGTWGRVKGLFR